MAVKTSDRDKEPATAKRRGRPARLSAETVIQAALLLLDSCSADEFTMTRVAQAVGTTTMALYRYFPSREALLEALANHVFGGFRMPAAVPGERWQDRLFAWQCALKSHIERYQTLTRLMAWNGHLSGAWLRVQMPVIEALHGAGLRGRALADATTWFLSDTVGLLTIASADLLLSFDGRGASEPGFRALDVSESLDYLDGRQRALVLDVLPHIPKLDPEAMIRHGFRHLIRGIEALVEGVRISDEPLNNVP